MKLREYSIIKTLFFNFYYLPFKTALSFPFRVAKGVKISDMGSKRSIILKNQHKKVYIGTGSSFALGGKTCWHVSRGACLQIDGDATFGKGSQIIVDGNLQIGDHFYCNANCIINCGNEMKIGNDVLIGWNVTILDGDGHHIAHNNIFKDIYEPVKIGDHVWIASNASVLKGSDIKSGTVVGYGSIISKSMEKDHVLLGGINKVLKDNIDWRK